MDRLLLLHLDKIIDSKNLLAFSSGVDSTCLFYVLLEHNIAFDMAIVDYNLRAESKLEVEYARELAKKHNKRLFIKEVKISCGNFESKAREARYSFFREIIAKFNYQNLLIAHQLNDRVEWLLMQLLRGCALSSLLGFNSFEKLDGYSIIRPLSKISRDEILAYLNKRGLKYFIDKSNDDERFTRNYIRKNYANMLVKKHKNGLLKSLEYLKNDFLALYGDSDIKCVRGIYIVRKQENMLKNLHNISLITKKLGYVLSKAQRDEVNSSKYSCVIAGKIIIDSNDMWIFMLRDSMIEAMKAGFHYADKDNLKSIDSKDCYFVNQNVRFSLRQPPHSKKFRDILRRARIPKKIRAFVNEEILEEIKTILK